MEGHVRELIDLHLSCSALPRVAELTSDSTGPFAVFQVQVNDLWFESDRTEVDTEAINPHWPRQFRMAYRFDAVQAIRVLVFYRQNAQKQNLGECDFLGSAEFILADLARSLDKRLELPIYSLVPSDLTSVAKAPRALLKRSSKSNVTNLVAGPMLIIEAANVAVPLGHRDEVKAGEEMEDIWQFQFQAIRKLAKKDSGLFAKSDPYLTIHRRTDNGSWIRVWKSEIVYQNLLPQWQVGQVPVMNVCGGDLSCPIRFEIWDYDADEEHDYMGFFELSLNQLLAQSAVGAAGSGREMPVIEEERTKERGYTESGAVNIVQSRIISSSTLTRKIVMSSENVRSVLSPSLIRDVAANPYRKLSDLYIADVPSSAMRCFSVVGGNRHYFLDYIAAGVEINVICAIDFTGSNGNPTKPTSLHYLDPSSSSSSTTTPSAAGVSASSDHVAENQYETALHQVSEVLMQYDTDKVVPMYGFGLIKDNRPHTLLKLEDAVGVDGILSVYRNTLRVVTLSAPTWFAPIIQEAIVLARATLANPDAPTGYKRFKERPLHHVLLLLCDGMYEDRVLTMQSIVEASKYPLSIVIVGVGTANFDAMNELDSDDRLLQDGTGGTAEADIVQFVAFKQLQATAQRTGVPVYDVLAREVLAEIPEQFCQFMERNGLPPPGVAIPEAHSQHLPPTGVHQLPPPADDDFMPPPPPMDG